MEPPLAKKEIVELFMDIVQPQFHEKMVVSKSLGFYELVVIGACVEHGLRNGKLAVVTGTSNANLKKFSTGFPRKKEGETNAGKGSSKKKTTTIIFTTIICSITYSLSATCLSYSVHPTTAHSRYAPSFNQHPAQAYQ